MLFRMPFKISFSWYDLKFEKKQRHLILCLAEFWDWFGFQKRVLYPWSSCTLDQLKMGTSFLANSPVISVFLALNQ